MELTPTTSERSRAPGHSAAARALAEALSAGESAERGAELLPILREAAATVGPKYADVMSREDVLGELVLGAWDGWLEDSSFQLQPNPHG